MTTPEFSAETLKQVLKEALSETLHEQRDFLRDIFEEVLEDTALVEAIREGEETELVRREQVFAVLEGET
jgi:AAA+ superfamily predicted ATPase